MGNPEGQGDGWKWYCASMNGLNDVVFESDVDLTLGELPHTLKVRKLSALKIKEREDGKGVVPMPIPWVAIGLGCVDATEEGTIQGAAIIGIWPASEKFVRCMNEIYRDTRKESSLAIVESGVPRNLKR